LREEIFLSEKERKQTNKQTNRMEKETKIEREKFSEEKESGGQGCQIFLLTTYQNGGKCTK
jgi:hypothetical protein